MARLAVYLFGAPRYELDGVPLALDHHKPTALLTYLLLTGQLHTRETLAALFWPEHGQARTFLRNNLYIIRQALGKTGQQWLYTNRDLVVFQPDSDVWADVSAFRHALLPCPTANHPDQYLCPICTARLEQAVTLYQADFLTGFTLRDCPDFDEWQFFQSERLRQELAGALQKLLVEYSQRHAWDAAIQVTQRWLALDPLHEPAHRRLMQLYVYAGQPTAALRQYQECERILADGLHVSPEQETLALYQAIKARQLSVPGIVKAQTPMSPPLPLTAPAQPPHNLLAPLTPLFGREQERTQLQTMLRCWEIRLVTLTGPAGVGKTRFGSQVAADLLGLFPDGVYFISLAPIRDSNLVMTAIAQILGISASDNQSPLETLKVALRHKQMLLVLDNFEHLIAAAASVTTLLATCVHMKMMVTSREVLQVQGEYEFPVSTLTVPPFQQETSLTTLAQYPAVQLFVARARAVKPDFVLDNNNALAVAAICARLDGLPLALELAAARIKLFAPQALLKKLTRRSDPAALEVLSASTRNIPERHQTLRNAIAWSYDLLTSHEQKLLRQLAVFVGGFSLQAASAVCDDPSLADERIARGLQIHWPSAEYTDVQTVSSRAQTPVQVAQSIFDGIASLVNKSLVQRDVQADGEPSFMLLETIREYGLDLLQAQDELLALQRSHAAYYLLLAVEAAPHLHGPDESAWIQRLTAEQHNLQAALDWAVAQRQITLAMHLSEALFSFWHRTSQRYEAIEMLRNIVTLADNLPPSFSYGRFLFSVALALEGRDGVTSALTFYQRSLAVSRAVGDKFNIANSLNKLGGIAYARGDYATWEANLRESEPLKLEVGGHYLYALVMGYTGRELTQLGRFAEGRALCEQALTLHRQLGDKWGLIIALLNFSQAVILQGDVDRAEVLAQEALDLAYALAANHLITITQHKLGLVALARMNYDRAAALLCDALQAFRLHKNYHAQVEALETFAKLALAQQQPQRALCLAGTLTRQYAATERVLPPVLQRNFDQMIASARQQLAPNASATAWATGEAMTLDEAVAYALAEVMNLPSRPSNNHY